MPRIVWFVLNDGTSVVAGCGSATRDSFVRALQQPESMLTLTSDDNVEQIPIAAVRDFVVFDAKATVPAATAIYRLVHV